MAKKRKKAKRPAENRENIPTKLGPNRKIKPATAALGPSAPERERLEVISFYRARQKLREQAANDRAQRYKEFLAGIRNPNEPPLAGRALLPSDGKRSLRILAEGDSWFEYPLPVVHGDGVIYQLEQLLGYPIANMAHHGLEVEQMMGLSIRQEIIAKLSDPQVKFDALLFSGGGNDIVGDQFCIWLKDSPPLVPPAQMLDLNAVDSALAILEAEFLELVDLRDQYSAETLIFTHAYDFPPITGIGVCGAGPWLKPSLDYVYKRVGVALPDPNVEFFVVKKIMQMFEAMLARVAADPTVKKSIVVPTQGTLTPTAADWQNEIHPSPAGFKKIAQKFQASLASAFP